MPDASSTPAATPIEGRRRVTAMASSARPVAVTPANMPSADTPIQTAPGNRTRNGIVARAASSSPSVRTVTGMATATSAPARTQTVDAQAPPPRPMRSRPTNTRNAPGGCPETCVVHESGWKSRIRPANPRSIAGTSWTPATSLRYSSLVVSRPAKPRCQPSTSASDTIQATAAAYPIVSSRRHSRSAASR